MITRVIAGIFILFMIVGDAIAATADPFALTLNGEMTQGGLIVGQVPPGTEIFLNDVPVAVSDSGAFVFGFGRDYPTHATLSLRRNGITQNRELAIRPRRYDIQRIDGLPDRQVTPDATDVAQIQREAAEIDALRKVVTQATDFLQGWHWPVTGPISGVYGSQRILNGKPRQPHYGLDIAAAAGTPVVASASGRIVVAAPDLYFTGGTVMIDHGLGVTSLYSHLSRVDVVVGQRIEQDERIGAVGATGRVSGAHLDFRINWLGERIDPALILKPLPK